MKTHHAKYRMGGAMIAIVVLTAWVLPRIDPHRITPIAASAPAPVKVQTGKLPARLAAKIPDASTVPTAANKVSVSSPMTGDLAKAELRKNGQYESLGEALSVSRHAVEKIDPTGRHSRGAEYYANNPGQQLRAWFSGDGIELASGNPTHEDKEPWRVKLRMRGVGRAGDIVPVGHGVAQGGGGRVEIKHPEASVSEWYQNSKEGLEQGFTLMTAPKGDTGDAVILIENEGNLDARAMPGPDGIRFVDSTGADALYYTGLKAWDADGRALPARMEIRRPAELALIVADAGARYPLTVDPWFANIEARLVEDSVAGDFFGRSVALAGDTALIGTPEDDTARGQAAGSAHVFVRIGSVWRHQAKLTAVDGTSSDYFGTSVALSGDSAIIGSPNDYANGRGSAYVFVRNGVIWSQQKKLVANDSTVDQFGLSVAIESDTILIGAPSSFHYTYHGAGSACVFVRIGESWTQQATLLAPDDSMGDQFGFAVALSGDKALVGAPDDHLSGISSAGSAYVFTRNINTWSYASQLTASDAGIGDRFGYSVAISDEIILIGAPYGSLGASGPASNPGSAYIFAMTGQTWSEQTRLLHLNSSNNDHFGWSVALDGDTALIGAPSNFTVPMDFDFGSVHAFTRNAGVWGFQVKFDALNASHDDAFGISVACSGDTVLIGAAAMDTLAGNDAGAVFVFTKTGEVWQNEAMLVSSDGMENDSFGTSVAMADDTVLVGAPYDRPAGEGLGAAYVYQRTGQVWHEQARLTSPEIVPGEYFGSAAAIDHDTAIVGTLAGAAYVFVRTGGIWGFQQKLTVSTVPGDAQFGRTVSISGETAAVGAFEQISSAKPGRVYVFLRNGTVWSQQAELTAPEPLAGDNFGSSVAIRGDTLVAGAPEDTALGLDAGCAYVFARNGAIWSRQAKLTATDGAGDDRFGYSVALADATALIGSPRNNTPRGADAGSAYVFIRNGDAWMQQAKLTALDGSYSDNFGMSVALEEGSAMVGAIGADLPVDSNTGAAYLFTRTGVIWNQQIKLTAGPDASSLDQFGCSLALSGGTAVVGAKWEDTKAPFAGSVYAFTLGELPSITRHPASRTVVPGQSATFEMTASGYAPLNYQWRKDGNAIAEATSASYTISAVEVADQGNYDCVVSNLGGAATSAPALLTVNALSQFTQSFPGTAPEARGYVIVNISPSHIGGAWRFVGEQQWRPAGIPALGLTTSDRIIEFRPMPGYIHPPSEPLSITSGGVAVILQRDYYESTVPRSGGMIVVLKPDSLTVSGLSVEQRAQWRLLGEDNTHWRDSGATLSNLVPGNYLVECKTLPGRSTPSAVNVTVTDGNIAAPVVTYFLAGPQIGTPPEVLPFETVSTGVGMPYAHVGQFRSNAGSGTGFVVKRRVVATAGHVVFDDGTLSAATGMQWLLQRDFGTYDPSVQIPRGYFLLSGYAARRAAENTPGSSLPESQNLDAAALYFLEDAGRGGNCGFLGSDATDNEFLLSSAQKLLVGYPVDGISASNQGRMHATQAANLVFTRASGRTYVTSDIRSNGGASGGPLFVQFEGGAYYPAAIYLGGTSQTVVRSIDSRVIELFDLAEVGSTGSGNNTGGGITLTNVSGVLETAQPGSLKVWIEPPAAVTAGAGWYLSSNSTLRANGYKLENLTPDIYTLKLKTVDGFLPPVTSRVEIIGGQLKTVTFTYSEYLTSLAAWRLTNFGISTNTGPAENSSDPDGDGQPNLSEYAASTNPNNTSDVFKILTSQHSGSTFTVSAAGRAGRSYSLQRRSDLSGGTWSTLNSLGPLVADGPVDLSDSSAPTGKAFYRIQVTAP